MESQNLQKNSAKTDISRSVKTSGNIASQSKIQAEVLVKSLGLQRGTFDAKRLGASLPADRLSSSILSFARLFSLPLEPGFLAKIRRQVFSAQGLVTPKGREAIAFAALAAASKGLELNAAGLAEYAAAMEPESPFNSERRKKHSGRGQDEAEKQENKKNEILTGSPSWLKNMILKEEEQNPLLGILNRLPGRNGQRWLTLPFSFTEDEDEYRLCLKILLNEGAAQSRISSQMTGHLTLEIVKKSLATSKPAGKNQHWLFVLDAENNKNLRLRVCLEPAKSKKAQKSLVSGLSEIMQIPPENITIKNFADSFSFET